MSGGCLRRWQSTQRADGVGGREGRDGGSSGGMSRAHGRGVRVMVDGPERFGKFFFSGKN